MPATAVCSLPNSSQMSGVLEILVILLILGRNLGKGSRWAKTWLKHIRHSPFQEYPSMLERGGVSIGGGNKRLLGALDEKYSAEIQIS